MFSRMNLTLVLGFAVAGLVLGTAGVTPCAANLIQNGSFELTDLAASAEGNSYKVVLIPNGTPDADMQNWTTFQTGGFQWLAATGAGNSPYRTAEDGSLFLNFTTTSAYIQQSFAVTPGNIYNVSFWEVSRYALAPALTMNLTLDSGATAIGTSGTLTVSGNGTAATPLTGGASAPTLTTWYNFTYSFVPSASANATLYFGSIVNIDQYAEGVYLDNVVVTATPTSTPEPGTLALLAAGLIGLLCYAWQKRK